METIKNISTLVLISIIIVFACNKLETTFLFDYLNAQLIGLLLTLLAINTATLGLVASKIQDIVVSRPEFDCNSTIYQMKLSLKEQIVLITLSIITLIIQSSKIVEFLYKIDITNVILIGVLIYSIDILWDTGKSVFVVIEELQKLNNKEKNK